MQEFNQTEREAIVLNAICGLIDEMVNYDMFAKEWDPSWSNVLLRSSTHARLFNILLVDFLSLPQKHSGEVPFGLKLPSENDPQSKKTYLFFLNEILDDPKLSTNSSDLRAVVEEFEGWLAGDTCIQNVWLSSLGLKIDMKINRIKALKMTGDICKHNFTRLSRRAKSLQRALSRNGKEKRIEECYQALPEFQRAQRRVIDESVDRRRDTYDVPNEIKNDLSRAKYWELMNMVRQGPCVPKFIVRDFMKSALN